ncbi:MAG: hypothetical protein RLZ98_919 [Pseudomonadota bacterium]|jgi:tetratricopeptide (TPR) repeat protein
MLRGLLILALLGQLWLAHPAVAEDAIDRLVRLAVRAQLDGKHDQALGLYTQAIGEQGIVTHRRAGLLSDRGVIYGRLGRTKAALDDFNESIKLYPENPSVYNNRGSVLLAIGYDREAIKDFNRAIVLAPGYSAAYLNRGSALLALRETGPGLIDYNHAVRLEADNAVVLSARGVVHLKDGRVHAALRDFSKAIATDARFDAAYGHRAKAHVELGAFDAAVEDLSRAIVFTPQDSKLYLLRGEAYLGAGDYEAASRDFTKALEIKGGLVAAYSLRGLASALMEEHEAALADLSRALELDQRSAVSYAFRGYVYVQMSQIALAERDLRTAKELDAKAVEVRWVDAVISEAQSNEDKAVELYKSVLVEKPEHALATKALERLKVARPFVPGETVPGRDLGEWQVVRRGHRFLAVNGELGDLEVRLETVGGVPPRLLDWHVRPPPHKRYGVLRFDAGGIKAGKVSLELENAAVIDITGRRVLAVVPHREGGRKAEWTWGEARLDIKAADGVAEVIELDARRSAPAVAQAGFRRNRPSGDGGVPSWAPWASGEEPPRRQARRRSQKKPKTLFDVLFGN